MTPSVARSRLSSTITQIRVDPLVRNSFFLMTTTGLNAALGFVFWLIVARDFSATEVGKATSLLSALALLSYFSLVGMSSSVVRRLPTSDRRAELVSSALITVAMAGLVVALLFAIIAPLTSPPLDFLTEWSNLAIFVVLATFAALSLLLNSVLVALRSAKYNLIINGVLMGGLKIALPFLFVGAGAMGIFASSGLASLAAVVAALYVLRRRLRLRVRWTYSWSLIRDSLRYSLGNYVSGSLNLVPPLIIPIIILSRLGPEIAATYFVAFQIATVVNSASFAVGESLFAEGSYREKSIRALMIRSAAIMGVVIVPAVLIVVALADPVLAIFGEHYAATADATLVILAISSIPVAFHTWASFLLKITDRLAGMIVAEVVFTVATVVLILLVPNDPAWVAAVWGVANLLAGVVALAAFYGGRGRRGERASDVAAVPRGDLG